MNTLNVALEAEFTDRYLSLAGRRFTDYPVTSVFLDLRPNRSRRPGLVFLKKELSRLEGAFPPRSQEAEWLRQDIQRVLQAVQKAPQKKANFMAVFVCSRENLLEEFFWALAPESDLRVPNAVVRGFRPRLYPLALLADRLENFLLLVADLRGGELFKVEAGRITESKKTWARQHPEARREKGGAYDRRVGFARTTFSKRVEGHWRKHEEEYFRELAETAVDWAKTAGIRSIILGADRVAGPPVQAEIARRNGHLMTELAAIDVKLSTPKKLALGIRAFRKKEEEVSKNRVEELFSPGRRQAAFGANEVLSFLAQSKRARVLVLDEAFHKEALLCGGCSSQAPKEAACPVCSGPVAPASVENELVCLAVARGVEIEFVKDSKPLAQRGGVGLLA